MKLAQQQSITPLKNRTPNNLALYPIEVSFHKHMHHKNLQIKKASHINHCRSFGASVPPCRHRQMLFHQSSSVPVNIVSTWLAELPCIFEERITWHTKTSGGDFHLITRGALAFVEVCGMAFQWPMHGCGCLRHILNFESVLMDNFMGSMVAHKPFCMAPVEHRRNVH